MALPKLSSPSFENLKKEFLKNKKEVLAKTLSGWDSLALPKFPSRSA